MKRAELSELRAEFGVLSRTEEILKAKDAQIMEQLVSFRIYIYEMYIQKEVNLASYFIVYEK